VLTMHKVPARVTGGTVTPRWVRFQVLPAVGTEVDKVKELSEELATALDVRSCRISRRGAAVAIEVSRDDPQPVQFGALYRQLQGDWEGQGIPPMTAVLGLAEDGAPLLIRLPSPDVRHILIAGMQGAGKTMLLQTIVLSLAMRNDPNDLMFIVLGDSLPRIGHSLRELGHVPVRIESFGAAVLKAFCTLGKRLIFVGDDVKGGNAQTVINLSRLMQNEWHDYILAWDGVPPAEVASLFPVRLVGQVANIDDARTVAGQSGSGAERLMGRGDFVAVAEGRLNRFQAAFLGDDSYELGPRSMS